MNKVELDNQPPKIPEVIDLPHDKEIIKKLAIMLKKYEIAHQSTDRDSEYATLIDVYKETILCTLLADGTFETEGFLKFAMLSDDFNEETAHEAIRVINASCQNI